MPAEYPMYQWACDLFPIHRSLTGEGVRETLRYIRELLPNLKICEVPSGTKVFGWTVPQEWICREAYIEEVGGNRIVDLRNSNLHIVQYSTPVERRWVTREDLEQHLHSLPALPDAIPYVTSYFRRSWGFCLADRVRKSLRKDEHRVHIDSEFRAGFLNYGELIIPGEEKREVLLATNICHPSLGNNELSGPVVVAALAQWLATKPRRLTYRILFLPETIGALVYLSRHLAEMKKHTIAGYQVVCVGDEGPFSYLPSRKEQSVADRAAEVALKTVSTRATYSFLERGSDERQWCAPGVDLPVASIMRAKYGTYPQYHTSLDGLRFISQAGLEESFRIYRQVIEIIERNKTYLVTSTGEPFLGELYPSESTTGNKGKLHPTLNILAYADGTRDLIDLAETIGCDVLETAKHCETLREHGHLKVIE